MPMRATREPNILHTRATPRLVVIPESDGKPSFFVYKSRPPDGRQYAQMGGDDYGRNYIVKKWHAPSTEIVKKLAKDKERLDDHEMSLKELKEGQQVVCAGVMALLDHELHNGNTDQMQKARDDTMEYLQGKLTR